MSHRIGTYNRGMGKCLVLFEAQISNDPRGQWPSLQQCELGLVIVILSEQIGWLKLSDSSDPGVLRLDFELGSCGIKRCCRQGKITSRRKYHKKDRQNDTAALYKNIPVVRKRNFIRLANTGKLGLDLLIASEPANSPRRQFVHSVNLALHYFP